MTTLEKLTEARNRFYKLQNEINTETRQRVESEVQPLINKAAKLKSSIETEVKSKHQKAFSELEEALFEATQQYNKEKIEQSKNEWYPEGTVVYEWVVSNRWTNPPTKSKTGKTGIVEIYDGTKPISQTLKYSVPSIGAIIVRYLKKDGTPSLVFDSGNYNLSKWYSEGDTPDNNIKTRKEVNNEV